LSTTGKLLEKLILRTIQKHIEERYLPNASQFGFRADPSTTLQCTRIRLAGHVTLNLNNNMSTAAVFLDIAKVFDTTWHSGLLYKLSELEFSKSLNKLIASFLTCRKCKVLVEGEFSTPRKIEAGLPQGSALAPILYSLYINDVPAAPGSHNPLFVDDTCIYATEKHEHHVLCKVQRRLTAVKSWCERWNIKINEGNIQAIHFSRRLRVPDDVLRLIRRDIRFVNNVTCLGVTFDRRVTRRHHIENTVAKALPTYVSTYSLFKSARLNTSIKLTLYEALIRSLMTHACPT
jgi:hypothetical protein